jgi:Tol biopolymer transport system component
LAPSWSHDGNTVAYVSTDHFCDGRLGAGCDGVTYNAPADPGSTADIYTVPYAGGAGGTAKPVAGASDPTLQEYYPVFAPDDSLLAFCRAPNGVNMYDQLQAEVFVIPAAGGTATRLAANDPPACTGQTSPGITNSWPKWGPVALQADASTYYWLVFSSTRPGNPQLYITAVVEKGGKIATYGSIYLWNQPATENNHTPAWDTFKGLPPAPDAGPPPK